MIAPVTTRRQPPSLLPSPCPAFPTAQLLQASQPLCTTHSSPLSPRIREQFPGTEMEKYALFIYESLKKTKCREFVPSRDEIEALIHRQEMTSTVYCHGGGSCKITINSHTTAGEVGSADSPLVLDARLPRHPWPLG